MKYSKGTSKLITFLLIVIISLYNCSFKEKNFRLNYKLKTSSKPIPVTFFIKAIGSNDEPKPEKGTIKFNKNGNHFTITGYDKKETDVYYDTIRKLSFTYGKEVVPSIDLLASINEIKLTFVEDMSNFLKFKNKFLTAFGNMINNKLTPIA